eukprot:100881_1
MNYDSFHQTPTRHPPNTHQTAHCIHNYNQLNKPPTTPTIIDIIIKEHQTQNILLRLQLMPNYITKKGRKTSLINYDVSNRQIKFAKLQKSELWNWDTAQAIQKFLNQHDIKFREDGFSDLRDILFTGYCVYIKNTLVGVILSGWSYRFENCGITPSILIAGIAIAEKHRYKGLGTALLQKVHNDCMYYNNIKAQNEEEDEKIKYLELNSYLNTIGFYQKNGYQINNDFFR